jgi:hypothetical protein
MKITTYLKSLFVAGLSVFILSGCSSGSSASGIGIGVSGFWAGTLYRNGAAYTNFSMSLVQIGGGGGVDNVNDTFAPSTLEGTFNANDKCIGGGVISGEVINNNVIIDVAMSNGGTLNMAGSAQSGSSMTGSWSSAGGGGGAVVPVEGTVVDEGDCDLSGIWTAGR